MNAQNQWHFSLKIVEIQRQSIEEHFPELGPAITQGAPLIFYFDQSSKQRST